MNYNTLKMHSHLSRLVLLVLFYCCFTRGKPRTDIGMLQDVASEASEEPQQQSDDPDIEEIANREYETVHGRILAVNMAHWEKRKKALRERETKRSDEPDVFENIEKDNEGMHVNGLYQGDIVLDEDLEKFLHLPNRTRTKRNALRRRKNLWHTRYIPYKLTYAMMHIKKNLLIAISEFHKHTCLRFVPYRPGVHRNYIGFGKKDGCSSRIGRMHAVSGMQTVSIGRGCNWPGTIIHELLHAVGFFHEQARSDRDKYVSIKWENIIKGFADQFEKYSWITIDKMGLDYDYESIMHYDRRAFTKNGEPTIVAVGNENKEFGTKNHRLSTKDIIEINALYNCQTKRLGWTNWSDFTPCDKKCNKYRERYCYHSGNPKQCGGNVNAYGVERDNQKCTKMECLGQNSINGHWGHWGPWTSCSTTCDEGTRIRTRRCDNPAPSKYGKPCKGQGKEKTVCTVGRCHLESKSSFWNVEKQTFYEAEVDQTSICYTDYEYCATSDHTKGTAKGYYLYMESSRPAKRGDKAILTSPTLTAKKEFQCLKFYYTMYGNTMGSLEVILYQLGIKSMIFSMKGNRGKPWHLGTATIQAKSKFSIEIIGTVGNTGYSDIAIDDIYLDDGKCSCQDKYISCIKWSAKGECKANKAWMRKHCPRSCHVCGQVKVKKCKDSKVVQCPLWAKKGECTKNKKYMHKHCAKSCKICKVAICKDTNTVKCPLWAKKGECEKNKKWMHKNCAKSCKICKVPLCADNNPNCSKWAKKGECAVNPLFMLANCKKSCNTCK